MNHIQESIKIQNYTFKINFPYKRNDTKGKFKKCSISAQKYAFILPSAIGQHKCNIFDKKKNEIKMHSTQSIIGNITVGRF